MKKTISILICFVLMLTLTACKKMEPEEVESKVESEEKTVISDVVSDNNENSATDIKFPKIMSDDSVMPTYVDISLYDEENYADIYLGKDFEYDVVYEGIDLSVPMTYDELISLGFEMIESDNYNVDSNVLAGKSLWVDFANENGKKLSVLFYNNGTKDDEKALTSIKNCSIVKFAIKENVLINADSQYGQFVVNGVNNSAVITDIIEKLGYPSHFYRVSENHYYLDWFITAEDRRSEITIYINTLEDHIEGIEFSYYG